MKQQTIPLLLLTILTSLTPHTTAQTLEASLDGGKTWQIHTTPHHPPSIHPHHAKVHLRLSSSRTPLAELPACALNGPLHVSVVRDAEPTQHAPPLAFRWRRLTGCEPSSTTPTGPFETSVANIAAPILRPHWFAHVRQPADGPDGSAAHARTGSGKGRGKRRVQGFWIKYGLWIMIAIGVALGHGIRKGLALLKREQEEEDAREAAQRRTSGATNDAGRVRVVVPTRGKSARSRRRAGASSRP